MGIKISQFIKGSKSTQDVSTVKSAGDTSKTQQNTAAKAKTSSVKNSEDTLQTASFGKALETFPKDKYNSSDWQDINPAANKVLGVKTGGYTYTASDGIKIKLDNIDNVVVKQNTKTGEIVVAGLNNGTIKGGSKDTKLTIYDSILDKISLNSGNDFLEIFNSEIEKIETGKGHDEINVSNSKVKNINAGKGNDKINIENSASDGTIKGGGGDDYIQVNKSNIFSIKGDDGKDGIFVNDSIIHTIYGDKDDDTIVVNNTTGVEKLSSGKGNDIINVSNSQINTLDDSKGVNNTIVNNSKIGNIKAGKNGSVNSVYDKNINSAALSSIQILDEKSINEAIDITKTKTSAYNHALTPEEEMQAVTVDFFENNLNSMKTQFEKQEKEDGSISDAYNWAKQLTDLGVAREDINSAIKEQEQMLKEMKDAINGNSDKSFEEVFKNWTGVEYNKDNISEYMETSYTYSLAVSGLVKTENFKSDVSKASNLGEVSELYANYFGSEELGRKKLNELLQESFMENPQEFGYPTSVEINENNELVITRPKEWGAMGPVDGTEYETTVESIFDVTNMMNTMGRFFNLDKYTDDFTSNIEKTIGCSLEELQNETVSKQLKSFGKGNSFQKLIDRYCAEQNGFADKLGSITQKCGLGLMATGGIVCLAFPPAAGAGVAMMNAGKWAAIGGMFGDNAIELADNLTSENGLSKDEALGLAKESITELALLYSGSKINGVSMGVKNEVLNATQSKALAYASQIGADATLSLLTDLVITGDVNLTGEGISQLMGIITGLAGAKVNSYSKESFDAADELFKNNDIDGAKNYLKEKGFSSAQIESHFKQFNASANDTDLGASVNSTQAETLLKQEMTELTGANKDIADRLKWDDTQRSQYLDLLNRGVKSSDAQWFILDKMQADTVSDFAKYVKSGLDGESVAAGMKSGWSGEQFELGAKLNDVGMYSKDIVECINKGWDAIKCDKYVELSNKGVDTYFLKNGLDANWTDKHWDSYQKLSAYVNNRYTLDDMQYKFDMKWSADDFSNFTTLVTSGIDADMASKGIKANWSADHWNVYNDLAKYSDNKLTLNRIMDKADFKWSVDEFASYANLIKSGENIFDASAKISGTAQHQYEYKLSIDPKTGKQNLDAEMFFVNVQGYGRDTDWGTKMAKATEDTSELVSMGAEYTEVVSFFVNETRQIQADAANPAKNGTGRIDSAMMNDYGLLKNPGESLMTPITTGRYSYFIDKLAAAADNTGGNCVLYNKASLEFPLASTTRVDLNFDTGQATLWHPAGENNFKYAENIYNDLMKMDNPSTDTVIDSVAKMHWLLAQNAPFKRGSDSISSGLSKAILRSYGIEVSPLKEGVSVDFEAFSMNMEDFVKNYRSFYVSEPKKIN